MPSQESAVEIFVTYIITSKIISLSYRDKISSDIISYENFKFQFCTLF